MPIINDAMPTLADYYDATLDYVTREDDATVGDDAMLVKEPDLICCQGRSALSIERSTLVYSCRIRITSSELQSTQLPLLAAR
jgi:hypothetical protein